MAKTNPGEQLKHFFSKTLGYAQGSTAEALAHAVEADPSDPVFLERIARIVRLITEAKEAINLTETIKASAKPHYNASLDRLLLIMLPQNSHSPWQQHRNTIDLDRLDMLDSELSKFYESALLDKEDIDRIINEINELRSMIESSSLVDIVKKFLFRKLAELDFFLRNASIFGSSAIMDASFELTKEWNQFKEEFEDKGEIGLFEKGMKYARSLLQLVADIGSKWKQIEPLAKLLLPGPE